MTDDGETLFGKRVLVEISHAIERFALAAEPQGPMVVIAMFQKLSYFERETSVYRDIAASGAVTLVGLVEDFPPQLPAGVRHTLLEPGDPLAREWSVTVLSPRGLTSRSTRIPPALPSALSSFRFLVSAHRLGAGGAGQLHSLGATGETPCTGI